MSRKTPPFGTRTGFPARSVLVVTLILQLLALAYTIKNYRDAVALNAIVNTALEACRR